MALLPRITIEWPHLLMLGQINSWKHGWKSRICGDIPSTRTASLNLWSDPLGNANRWSHGRGLGRHLQHRRDGCCLVVSSVRSSWFDHIVWFWRIFAVASLWFWLKCAYNGLNLITVLCWCSLPRALLIPISWLHHSDLGLDYTPRSLSVVFVTVRVTHLNHIASCRQEKCWNMICLRIGRFRRSGWVHSSDPRCFLRISCRFFWFFLLQSTSRW